MEVVRSNFDVILPQVESVIKQSVLIAIDTEFTGLSLSLKDERNLFDSIDERYQKIRRTVANFTICQFGLSGFIKDEHKNLYVAHTFNFYLFPKEIPNEFNPRLLIQTSNMEFLCQHKFDFNKWICEGIPYCNQQEEELLSETDEKQRAECVGFRKVFQLLVKHKKPIMGHNMLLDLAYILEKFHAPLPDQYSKFKETVHTLFPTIIDTKTICFTIKKKLDNNSAELLDKTGLGDLYEAFKSQKYTYSTPYAPEVFHSEKCSKYSVGKKYHEAGFDAYCVGFVFLRMVHLLAMKEIKARPVHVKQYLRMIETDINKVNLIKGPLNCINLAGPDGSLKVLNLLLVESANGEDISLHSLRLLLNDIDIQMLSKDSVLIAVPFKNRESQIIQRLKEHLPLYKVTHYSKRGSLNSLCRSVVPYAGAIVVLTALYYMYKSCLPLLLSQK